MASADMVRAGTPARSIAASSASAFITVASMPIVSPVGRAKPATGLFGAADEIAAADHDAEVTPSARAATRSAAMRRGWPAGCRSHSGPRRPRRTSSRSRGGRPAWPSGPSVVRIASGDLSGAVRAGGAPTSAAKSDVLLLDAFAERVAREARDLDRRADLAFGFLDRLRDALRCRRR